jgi:5-methylcytosine-specific restriction endonuclease McrA
VRRIHRGALPLATRLELYGRSKQCDSADATRVQWKSFRKSAAARPLMDELKRMAGTRGRCFYCSDARGADIDHFVPIDRDFRRSCQWANLLWVCPECNRKKNATFPVDDGRALLIDPTMVDPWSRLILDVSSCVLAPRFRDATPDRSGVETLRVLDILNYEAVIAGRARTVRRLIDAASTAASAHDRPTDAGDMWREISEDEYGVSAWFALWEGQDSMPFAAIKQRQPRVWRHLVRVVVGRSRP